MDSVIFNTGALVLVLAGLSPILKDGGRTRPRHHPLQKETDMVGTDMEEDAYA